MAEPRTIAHRRELWRLRAETIRGLRVLWPRWDPTDSTTWNDFGTPATALVARQADRAAELGARYYLRVRKKRAPLAPALSLESVPRAAADPEKIAKSLGAVGLAGTYIALRYQSRTLAQAKAVAFVRVTMAAGRHVANGSRATILAASRVDPASEGWARVTAGTCDFCAGLSDEGIKDVAAMEAHDGCQCVAEPSFEEQKKTFKELDGTAEQARENVRLRGKLNNLESARLESYVGAGYEDLNYALRETGGDLAQLTRYETDTIAALDGAIERSVVKNDIQVYRGLSFEPECSVGDVLVDDAFVSTSMRREVAESFGGDGWLMTVELPSGERALYTMTGEDEFLLPRGTRFLVRSIDRELREMTVRVVSK